MTDYEEMHDAVKARRDGGEKATPEEIAKVVLIMGDGNPKVGLDTLKVLHIAMPKALADEITDAMQAKGMIPEDGVTPEAIDKGVDQLPEATAELFGHWAMDHMDSITDKIGEAIEEIEEYLACRSKIADALDVINEKREAAPSN